MSNFHRPNGDFESRDDHDLHQRPKTDALNDADAFDAWLNEIARNNGSPSTRSGNSHDRPDVRTGNHDGTSSAESLAATAASFHRRIEAAQSRDARATRPDPRLWEKIMEKTTTTAGATASPTRSNSRRIPDR